MLSANLLPHTPFSQRDPKWADINIGSSRTTIGRAGCTITATASSLVALDVDTDPGRLNRYLATHEGFVSGNLMRFNAFGPLGISCVEVIECADRPAPVHRIIHALHSAQAVIALVDFTPGGSVNQHWVRILDLDDNDAMIMDPWTPPPDPIYYLMARYATPAWHTPARALFRIAIYAKGDQPARISLSQDLQLSVSQPINTSVAHLTKRPLQLRHLLLY